MINALIETNRIESSSGKLDVTTLESGGGSVQDVYRCPDCRIVVWSDYGRRPGLRFVRVGTLDDPASLPPNAHVFIRSKLPWVRLPDAALAFEEYFDIKEHWSAESLERLRLSAETGHR